MPQNNKLTLSPKQNKKLKNAAILKDPELQQLQKEQRKLHERISYVERHLSSGYSEPLQKQYFDLKKEDFSISAQVTDILVKNI